MVKGINESQQLDCSRGRKKQAENFPKHPTPLAWILRPLCTAAVRDYSFFCDIIYRGNLR